MFDFVRDRFDEARRNGDASEIEYLIDEMQGLIDKGKNLIKEIEEEYPLEDEDEDE
jgi:hypothetical protein